MVWRKRRLVILVWSGDTWNMTHSISEEDRSVWNVDHTLEENIKDQVYTESHKSRSAVHNALGMEHVQQY